MLENAESVLRLRHVPAYYLHVYSRLGGERTRRLKHLSKSDNVLARSDVLVVLSDCGIPQSLGDSVIRELEFYGLLKRVGRTRVLVL